MGLFWAWSSIISVAPATYLSDSSFQYNYVERLLLFISKAGAVDGGHVCTVLHLRAAKVSHLSYAHFCWSFLVSALQQQLHMLVEHNMCSLLDGLMAVHKCMLHVSLGHCRNVFRFHKPLSLTSSLMFPGFSLVSN